MGPHSEVLNLGIGLGPTLELILTILEFWNLSGFDWESEIRFLPSMKPNSTIFDWNFKVFCLVWSLRGRSLI